MALRAGAQPGGGRLRQVFLEHAQGPEGFKDGQRSIPEAGLERAAEKYEEVLAQRSRTTRKCYFFLGNSYDKLYKPAEQGEPANDAYIQKAIENYRKAADKTPNPDMEKARRSQYLVAAYGSDKLNDPVKAEPVVQKIIALEPNEPGNYFALAKIYEDAGATTTPRQALHQGERGQAQRPVVSRPWPATTTARADFAKTIEALHKAAELEPNNPRGVPPVAVYYWDKSRQGLPPHHRAETGLHPEGDRGEDKALALNPDYIGSADLQEHPAPHPGATSKRPGQAAAH